MSKDPKINVYSDPEVQAALKDLIVSLEEVKSPKVVRRTLREVLGLKPTVTKPVVHISSSIHSAGHINIVGLRRADIKVIGKNDVEEFLANIQHKTEVPSSNPKKAR